MDLDRGGGRSAAHGDACRAAEALFVSWVVEMGAWDVCEAVGTVVNTVNTSTSTSTSVFDS